MSRLLHLQWKRLIKAVPKLLLGAVIPVVLTGMTVFLTLMQKKDTKRLTAPVAIVNHDSEDSLSFVLPYVMKADATQGFSFLFLSEAEAITQLNNGSVCAVLVFPKDMLSGILDSTNIPATLILPKRASLPSLLLSKFAEAGTKTLGSAQAGVYTVIDLYRDYGKGSLSETTDQINLTYLPYAMSREMLFKERSQSATKELSLTSYYTATLILLLLVLFCSGTGDYLCNASSTLLQRQLRLNGYSYEKQSFSLFLPLFTLCSFIMLIISLPLFHLLEVTLTIYSILLLFLISAQMSLLTFFIFTLFQNPGRGLLALLFLSIVLIFVSGGFLPFAFLPKSFQVLSEVLPLASSLTKLRKLFSSSLSFSSLCIPFTHCLVLLFLCFLLPYLKRKETFYE